MKKYCILFSLLFICSNLSAYNIAVVTAAIGDQYQIIVAPSLENKIEYCEKHNYDFICLMHTMDASRWPAWSKIKLLEQVLSDCNYNWVFWSDADSLFMNFSVSIESLIDDHYDFILTKDHNGFNSGEFLLKNSEWSRNFLKKIYAKTQFIKHPHWEQAAIVDLLKNKNYLIHTKILPQRVMNSYQSNYKKGDFILHFPAVRGNALLQLLKKYSQEVVEENWSLKSYLKS